MFTQPDEETLSNLGHSPKPGRVSASQGYTTSPGGPYRSLDIPKKVLDLNDGWRMSTMRTPKSAEIVCPIPWTNLGKFLGLDEDMVRV